MNLHTHAEIHIHTYICTHTRTHAGIHTHTFTCRCTHTHPYTYLCTHTHTPTPPSAGAYPHTFLHAYPHMLKHTHTHFLTYTNTQTLGEQGPIVPLPSGPASTKGIHLAFQWQPQSSEPSGNTSTSELCQAGGEDSQGQGKGGDKTGRLPDSSQNDMLTPPHICTASQGPSQPLCPPGQPESPQCSSHVCSVRCPPPPLATPAPTLVTSRNSHKV